MVSRLFALVVVLAFGVSAAEVGGGGVFGEVNKEEIGKLTSDLPSEEDFAEYERLIKDFKSIGGEKANIAVSTKESNLMHQLASGDVSVWTDKDFDDRVKAANRLDMLRTKWRERSSSTDSLVWRKWLDWTALAENHKDFFSRLMYGFKNRAKVTAGNPKAFSQATYGYMNSNKKLFPDLKSKLVFCSQLAAAGVKDSGIAGLPKTLTEEAGAE